MTKIFDYNEGKINTEGITYAAEVLRLGGTVVFPTETVYGLGANALDANAIKKIFTAKGRPSDNPLIVHISDIRDVKDLAIEIPESFYRLADRFWPGPITFILKKSKFVPDLVSAGLNTIGIRIPRHPIALSLLRQAGVPVAAPSANISGSPSPTNVHHVITDLNGKVDVIIDGGECEFGLESTVLDLTGNFPMILRPGGVTLEHLKEVIDTVEVDRHVYERLGVSEIKPKSPGVKYKHYSPKAQVILVEGEPDKVADEILRQARILGEMGKKIGVLATEQTRDFYNIKYVKLLGDRKTPKTIAANLFKLLRDLDDMGIDVIFIEGIDKKGLGMAIMNRVIRAAGYNSIKV